MTPKSYWADLSIVVEEEEESVLLLITNFMPCSHVLCEERLERQLSLLKRKAFKNVEQMIFKGAQKNKQRNELLPNVQQ